MFYWYDGIYKNDIINNMVQIYDIFILDYINHDFSPVK